MKYIFKFGFELEIKKKYSDSQVDKNVINFLFPVTLPLAKREKRRKKRRRRKKLNDESMIQL